ncbi:MAG: AarF/ABC1/UbiB kinase family protein [Deltaproteobacteria bacterium]|nr:AarF/ABC1/UbiB kinase family protein [Deltaproteobacteria bacterium]
MPTKPKNNIPQSAFIRASKIFASGAKVMAREMASHLNGGKSLGQTRMKQAQDIVNTLGKLKGAAMKAGQLLSIEAASFLDPEVVAVLRQLQDHASFMPLDQVRFILLRQFGRDKFDTIEDISAEPIAAASIGQVHTATIAGTPVAIKIQYPGVAKTIDADLAALKTLIMSLAKMTGRQLDIEPVLDEINKSLKQEVNYLKEATNTELVRQALTASDYVIPRVYHEYTTETVLTESFETGLKVNEWIQGSPSRDEVQHFSQLVIKLMIDEMLLTGVVQTDPNYANFLYRPSSRQLVLLDFGATWTYTQEFRRDMQKLTLALLSGQIDEVMTGIYHRGYLDHKESNETKEHLREILRLLGEVGAAYPQPVALRDDLPHRQLRSAAHSVGRGIRHTSPPKDLVLIGRKLTGMLLLLREINAHVNFDQVRDHLRSINVA